MSAQVFGPCGTPAEDEAIASETLPRQGVPLPGQHAPNFALDAVVGGDIQIIKLSDANGKWRVLCFYPADFTFV